jgi:hypothetical protein
MGIGFCFTRRVRYSIGCLPSGTASRPSRGPQEGHPPARHQVSRLSVHAARILPWCPWRLFEAKPPASSMWPAPETDVFLHLRSFDHQSRRWNFSFHSTVLNNSASGSRTLLPLWTLAPIKGHVTFDWTTPRGGGPLLYREIENSICLVFWHTGSRGLLCRTIHHAHASCGTMPHRPLAPLLSDTWSVGPTDNQVVAHTTACFL